MSVKIGHASIDENGKASGGKAGDSTGKEVCIRSWYSKPWQYYLECTDEKVANIAATYMEQICNNDKVGYDQSERLTLYNQLKVHKDVSKLTSCECDCSSLVACCYIMAGLDINPSCTTRNLRSNLLSTGKFVAYNDNIHLSTSNKAKRGAIYLKEGAHVVMALENGKQSSISNNSFTTTCIDVSLYQGNIDWKKVKQSGVDYAILRGVIKNDTLDSTFDKNYINAIKNGIKILGVYQFSYALNESNAKNDAINMINKLNGKKINIWLDLEWEEQRKLGKDKVTSIAKSYVNTCKELKYTCHIYSNLDWYKNVYHATELKNMGCKFWIARYPAQDTGVVKEHLKPNVGECIWQYSSKGSVPGISGDVDMNIVYDNVLLSATVPPLQNSSSESSLEFIGKINTKSGNLNIRSAPNASSSKVGFYKKGELVQLISKTSDNWYKTDKGYISGEYVIAAKGKVSNCTKLNIRKEPEVKANNVVSVLNVNDEVCLMKQADNGWYKAKTKDNLVGYVSNKYITIL